MSCHRNRRESVYRLHSHWTGRPQTRALTQQGYSKFKRVRCFTYLRQFNGYHTTLEKPTPKRDLLIMAGYSKATCTCSYKFQGRKRESLTPKLHQVSCYHCAKFAIIPQSTKRCAAKILLNLKPRIRLSATGAGYRTWGKALMHTKTPPTRTAQPQRHVGIWFCRGFVRQLPNVLISELNRSHTSTSVWCIC